MGGKGIGTFTLKTLTMGFPLTVRIGKMHNGKYAPAQDWKKMYHVRKTINRRWKACTPNAIYLNGHTDSVYCCQFDEYVYC